MKRYTVETQLVQAPGTIRSNCNSIIFINKSGPGVIVSVNGYPIGPDEFSLDGGNFDEINETVYNVTANAANFTLYIKRKLFL